VFLLVLDGFVEFFFLVIGILFVYINCHPHWWLSCSVSTGALGICWIFCVGDWILFLCLELCECNLLCLIRKIQTFMVSWDYHRIILLSSLRCHASVAFAWVLLRFSGIGLLFYDIPFTFMFWRMNFVQHAFAILFSQLI
jgi:hypothetical protein